MERLHLQLPSEAGQPVDYGSSPGQLSFSPHTFKIPSEATNHTKLDSPWLFQAGARPTVPY